MEGLGVYVGEASVIYTYFFGLVPLARRVSK